ncbi:hypothetical protein C6558_23850 [Ensifer sp. NM-2]|nr:hypothetical protein C6558_23850 [Ensifer sp. NM-2]
MAEYERISAHGSACRPTTCRARRSGIASTGVLSISHRCGYAELLRFQFIGMSCQIGAQGSRLRRCQAELKRADVVRCRFVRELNPQADIGIFA